MIDEYMANYPVPRDISTPQAVIYQGLEPSTFIGYFDQWDKKFWDVSWDMALIGSLSSLFQSFESFESFEPFASFELFEHWDLSSKLSALSSLRPEVSTEYSTKFLSFSHQTHLTYEMERLNIDAMSNGHITIAPPKIQKYVDHDFDSHPKYPVELLRSEACRLPESVDPKMKELHLTHDDFVSIFHMNYNDFAALPTWKKQEIKKIQKLF